MHYNSTIKHFILSVFDTLYVSNIYCTNLLNDATKKPAAKPTKQANTAHKLQNVVTQFHVKILSNFKHTNNEQQNENILANKDNFYNNFNDSNWPFS